MVLVFTNSATQLISPVGHTYNTERRPKPQESIGTFYQKKGRGEGPIIYSCLSHQGKKGFALKREQKQGMLMLGIDNTKGS